MKKNYWSNNRTSTLALVAMAVVSMAGMGAVETLQKDESQPHLQEKLAAANLARQAMEEFKTIRQQRGVSINPVTDISQSGLIGESMSPVTSNNGSLPAKQTAVNPNFAAVVIDMLKQAGVQEGDTIAVGFSGSFPAMNICVLAAAESMHLKPIVISSASASQWGANCPELLWIDMEKQLQERGVFRSRSIAASLGGIEDRAIGIPEDGIQILSEAIESCELPLINPQNYLDSVDQRMALYRRHADGEPIKAYVNVGGGTVSVGLKKGKRMFKPGVNLHRPLAQLPADSVMSRMIGDNVPVIHLVHINDLAAVYGLPIQPTSMPRVGEGDVYSPRSYNKYLAGGLLLVIVTGLIAVWRTQPGMWRTTSNAARWSPHRTSARRQDEELEPL